MTAPSPATRRAVMERFPLLPLEEEGRLNDMPLRENFIERVFAYYRWTEMLKNEPTPGGLVRCCGIRCPSGCGSRCTCGPTRRS